MTRPTDSAHMADMSNEPLSPAAVILAAFAGHYLANGRQR